ncbi:MAG: alpha/beta hydrolase [Candidatus Sericytochromatia bacterium]|nr:alpha/beta hydrolase [Candidatus Sericytochromatia bacterium]
MRGHDRHHPLVLFLHGGPGDGQIGNARHYQAGLEAHAVVVNWDQRGAGLSQTRRMPAGTMTIAQLLADAHAVITRLLARFGQARLTLVGHSWGSILGMQLAQRHPELIDGYVGIGQITSILAGEQAGYDWVLAAATAIRHQQALQELAGIGRPPHATLQAMSLQGKWVSAFVPAIHHPPPQTRRMSRLAIAGEYTLWDRWRYRHGGASSMAALWDEVMAVDLPTDIPAVAVPVTFCLGRHDWVTPSVLADAYLQTLQAPVKRAVWFEQSAHCAHWEEPDTFLAVLRDRLTAPG